MTAVFGAGKDHGKGPLRAFLARIAEAVLDWRGRGARPARAIPMAFINIPDPSEARSTLIANCLKWLASRDKVALGQVKLQKLLFYVQGWSLAIRDQEAFDEEIKAWKDGPVVPSIRYATLKTECALEASDLAFVSSVWEDYKRYSGEQLIEMTHQEAPWIEAYKPDDKGHGTEKITKLSLRHHFQKKLRREIDDDEMTALVDSHKPPQEWYDQPSPFPSDG